MRITVYILVIVDTTAAPALYIVGHKEDFHGHTTGEINTGNERFHAQFQVDLHSFDQNILSFANSLF